MLKKIGLAAAAAIGLSMLATPAMAQPEAPAVEAPAVEAPAVEAPPMEAPPAEGVEAMPPAPSCQSVCVPHQCVGATQSLPISLPCGFGLPRPQILSGGLSALLALCLDLRLHLRPEILISGGCRSWGPC